jgi:SAM-dependent MidA family methyltransferase
MCFPRNFWVYLIHGLNRSFDFSISIWWWMMPQQQPMDDSNPVLQDLIAQTIDKHPKQRITFADYMDLVLYHPEQGYYTTKKAKIGAQGDFFTSPHLGSDFGELLAEQFVQMWEILNRPNPFTLVEMGAGQGILAQDILQYLHKHHFPCFDALEYVIVEKSNTLIAEQKHWLQSLVQSWGRLHWYEWHEIPGHSIVGCCFSNELVDAFPVHQIQIEEGHLQEVYVTITEQGLTPVVAELSTSKLADYFKLIDISFLPHLYPNGYQSEVSLAALDWMQTVAARLQQGYVLTIDYGYPAQRYYSPVRLQGTLQCYYQHSYHSNPYIQIGKQDITAHVDFTALQRQGERCGLQTVGFTQQGLFLMALGLGDRLAALSNPATDEQPSLNEILQRREALHSLINPMGLGNFGVLIQSKGLTSAQSREELKGLRTSI